MHDWHLADTIFKTILDYANKNGLKNVKRVELELGSILEHGDEISPENLSFNIKLLAEKGLAENLEVSIKKTRGDSWKLISIEGEN